MSDQIQNPWRHRATTGWFLLCSATIFGLIAIGSECGGIVYCYGDARDYWWHPTKVIGSLFFALLLPLPHILIALIFKSKRNSDTILGICKNWHRGVGLLIIGLFIAGYFSTQMSGSIDKRMNLDSELVGTVELQKIDAGLISSPPVWSDSETALIQAIECASFKKKLGNVDEAVKINGYVIYKFTENKIHQELSQKMIFEAIGKVNSFYAEHHQDKATVKRMEKITCSSAKAQLADFPT